MVLQAQKGRSRLQTQDTNGQCFYVGDEGQI
jgi:hypothetical protein